MYTKKTKSFSTTAKPCAAAQHLLSCSSAKEEEEEEIYILAKPEEQSTMLLSCYTQGVTKDESSHTMCCSVASALLHLFQGNLLKQLAGLHDPPQLRLEKNIGPGLQGCSLLLGAVTHQLVHLLKRIHCICCHILTAQGFLELLHTNRDTLLQSWMPMFLGVNPSWGCFPINCYSTINEFATEFLQPNAFSSSCTQTITCISLMDTSNILAQASRAAPSPLGFYPSDATLAEAHPLYLLHACVPVPCSAPA